MVEETRSLEYVDKLNTQRFEVGDIDSSDLATLVYKAPLSGSPTFFKFQLNTQVNAIPKSSGKIIIGDGYLVVEDVRYSTRDLGSVARGGKLEELEIDFPGFHGGVEGLMLGGRALKTFGGSALGVLRGEGYDLNVLSFRIAHYVVKTRDPHPGFFSDAIAGKMSLLTEEMVRGKEPRKLVFAYTSDVVDTPEFDAYSKLIKEIERSKK